MFHLSFTGHLRLSATGLKRSKLINDNATLPSGQLFERLRRQSGNNVSQIHYYKADIQNRLSWSAHNQSLHHRPYVDVVAFAGQLRQAAFLVFLAAAARAVVITTDLGSRFDGFTEQGFQVARLAHVLRQCVHGAVLVSGEVQIKPEAQRLILWAQTDSEPGLGTLGIFPQVAVPL